MLALLAALSSWPRAHELTTAYTFEEYKAHLEREFVEKKLIAGVTNAAKGV